jgi:hypothetical protein
MHLLPRTPMRLLLVLLPVIVMLLLPLIPNAREVTPGASP